MIPRLTIEDVHAGYNGRPVLNGLSLSVRPGQIVGILGRNGAGKSTVMRTVMGLLCPTRGAMRLDEVDICNLSTRDRVQRGLTYVPQGRECFPDMTVVEHLALATSPMKATREHCRKAHQYVINLFPALNTVLHRPARDLSGGLQQMLALAMGFAQRPVCLLLDEPSLGLGHSALACLQDGLHQFATAGGSVLLIEQKPQIAFSVASYLYFIEGGTVALEGVPAKLKNDSAFIERYLGMRQL